MAGQNRYMEKSQKYYNLLMILIGGFLFGTLISGLIQLDETPKCTTLQIGIFYLAGILIMSLFFLPKRNKS